MRLSAYKRATDEAHNLPASVPELKSYFRKDYSPRAQAVSFILKTARLDESLFDGEFVLLYKHAKLTKESS